MWVWDGDKSCKVRRKVIYINKVNKEQPVIALTEAGFDTLNYAHCAEIEEPKYHRMPHQEIAWWLQDGIKEGKHREWKYLNDGFVYYEYAYPDDEDSGIVGTDILIRENGGEWHEPLVEVE